MVSPSGSGASAPTTFLPDKLIPLEIETAKRDVFLPVQASLPAVSQPKPVARPMMVAATPPPAPPTVPQAPPANARFLGSMVTPEGKKLVYLMRGDSAVPVAAGQRLDDGYLVESLTAEAVTLLYPASGLRVVVPIPPSLAR